MKKQKRPFRTREEIRDGIFRAVLKAKNDKPLIGSITNTVTANFVANAQLASGGLAAMVYLPEEGEALARSAEAFYINMGTFFPFYAESLTQTAKVLWALGKPWVLDPVGVGLGTLRTAVLRDIRKYNPSILRGNASEIIALANLWQVDSGKAKSDLKGVDAMQRVCDAKRAALSLARDLGGVVAVSGDVDFITDGHLSAFSFGGSPWFTKITGAGCSLGGVAAVYAAGAPPFIAALAATALYNLAGQRAQEKTQGPAHFQIQFLDELYQATPEEIANHPFNVEEEEDLI